MEEELVEIGIISLYKSNIGRTKLEFGITKMRRSHREASSQANDKKKDMPILIILEFYDQLLKEVAFKDPDGNILEVVDV
ncbi:unnamed protein product [Sphenostylis stenocarpa]|uniref:Uncharacterized protein n=1 Tax=Sphenostylis stenocarpa TaxID=92480 RepID=A0AA87BCS3_9FABA|nr:unnamed protein product [Sphenostylis stenocarpa]